MTEDELCCETQEEFDSAIRVMATMTSRALIKMIKLHGPVSIDLVDLEIPGAPASATFSVDVDENGEEFLDLNDD